MTTIARITLKDDRTYRGPFVDADALRLITSGTLGTGDYAQVFGSQRMYRYDALSNSVDDGLDTIKPVDDPATGRWLSTSQIELSAVNSSPSQVGATLDTYEWFLVSAPKAAIGQPGVQLSSTLVDATITVPLDNDWLAGGVMVFLRVTDSLGEQSLGNPYSPFVNDDATFKLVLGTRYYGFQVAPTGARDWHEEFLATFVDLDEKLQDIEASVPGAAAPTSDDKSLAPSGITSGDGAVVPGVSISNTPGNGSYVRVFVNGLAIPLGNAVLTSDCYFSNDAGATARAIENIAPGDVLVWNGVIAGYDLDTSDVIDFDYEAL